MRRSILIDLTALLDVILILMYLVLVNATYKVEESKATALDVEALTARVHALEKENFELIRRTGSKFVLEQNCFIITLSVDKDESLRTILIEPENSTAERIELTWENGQYAKNILKTKLDQYVKRAFDNGFQIVFIVFCYDRNIIYYSDHKLINSVILTQKANRNIYSAEYDMSGGNIDG